MVRVVLFYLALLASVFGSPITLTLERAFPTNHGVELSQLKARDIHRHRRTLQSPNHIVKFPLAGNPDPAQAGLYFTKVQLGSPPRQFHVQIDTGSDILWVSCGSCNGCPQTSVLPIQLDYFDPGNSSTSSLISCSDQRCKNEVQSGDAICSINQCSFKVQYGDGSGTSGYYVSDVMHLALEGSVTTNYSAPIVFGCSNLRTGNLAMSGNALDGILGLGHNDMSVISQLYSQGIAPGVFSHCLKGDSSGGGMLVLGEIVEPNIIYSPLVPSGYHYNLNLQSISVNGHMLQIDPAVFATSSKRGTIIDSGTTLAYLAEGAYNPFVDAITASIPQSIVLSKGSHCYLVNTSITDIFPQVSLNFADDASLVLRPQDYLIQDNPIFDGEVWCLGFHKTPVQDITIIGDLVLKDKIFVYDLAGRRIGWANYDCSLPVNISASSGKGRSENARKPSGSASLYDGPHKVTKIEVLAFLMHMILILM